MSFRIIAIKTGEKPDRLTRSTKTRIILDPLKILKPNTIYPFYNHYAFLGNDLTNIIYKPENDIDLYNIQTTLNNIPVNINAVVGSNGSGKSTLVELLNWANYNIGCRLGLLKNDKGIKLKPFQFLDMQIVYSIDKSSFIKLSFKDGNITQQKTILKDNAISFDGIGQNITTSLDLSDFFYTVVVNYSHYALNSEEIGDWIDQLFHKNDGYQTPIVLNPMRIKGNIDINREKQLLNRRLQANLLEYVDQEKENENESLRNLVNGKIAKELKLQFSPPVNMELQEPKNPPVLKKIIESLGEYFDLHISREDIDNDLFTNVTLNYIYEKLVKIADTYKPFQKYKDGNSLKYVNAYIKKIKESNSHIIFKVKGAILYLKYSQRIFDGVEFNLRKSITLNIDKLAKLIKELNNDEPFWVNTFMMAPPSYFHVEIIPEDKTPFDALSSGEKQRIHSISSIVYHLINLNSVEQLKEEGLESYLHYNYINIVLDEIELYYHPDWQRKFIADLLTYIGKISADNLKHIKALNISFLTHSPFILSDIPSSNTLFLDDKGNPRTDDFKVKTFGANIHDLLKHSFFLKTGSIGEFAKNKINDTINYLNFRRLENLINSGNEKDLEQIKLKEKELTELKKVVKEFDKKKHKELIEVIDEPILKQKLSEMYDEVTGSNLRLNIIQKKIAELQAEEKLITSKV